MKNKEDKCGVSSYIFSTLDIGVYDYEVTFLEPICFHKIACKHVKKKQVIYKIKKKLCREKEKFSNECCFLKIVPVFSRRYILLLLFGQNLHTN